MQFEIRAAIRKDYMTGRLIRTSVIDHTLLIILVNSTDQYSSIVSHMAKLFSRLLIGTIFDLIRGVT